jgi:hypothetical protein
MQPILFPYLRTSHICEWGYCASFQWFFEAEKVELAAGVTGEDQLECIAIGTAVDRAVAGERNDACAPFLSQRYCAILIGQRIESTAM